MAEAPAHIAKIVHPAPHRDRITLAELAFALAAAPLAWVLQLIVGYGVASHVCFSGSAPNVSAASAWGHAIPLLFAVELAASLVAASGAAVSWRLWRATRKEVEGNAEEMMVEAGRGRTRFLALWGLMTSLGFLGAILFGLVGLLVVPLCGY